MRCAAVAKLLRHTTAAVFIAAQGATVFTAALAAEAVAAGVFVRLLRRRCRCKYFALQTRDGFEIYRHHSDVIRFRLFEILVWNPQYR
jgi:hypothetical protein